VNSEHKELNVSNYWGKQPSSRPINVLQLSSAVAVNSSPFGTETFQIRVMSNIATWAQIGTSTSSAGWQTAGSFYIPIATSPGEYFTVSPGQVISCISVSSATTGTVSICEMS
jgi:hypothetical protein